VGCLCARAPVAGAVQVSRSLRTLPYVEPTLPTLALVGAPNVGKSSLVRVLSSGVPEVRVCVCVCLGVCLGVFVGRTCAVEEVRKLAAQPGCVTRCEQASWTHSRDACLSQPAPRRRAQVCNYPFTTRSIKMGHFYIQAARHQVRLTPGSAACAPRSARLHHPTPHNPAHRPSIPPPPHTHTHTHTLLPPPTRNTTHAP
jgi:hypothetical protein